MPRSAKRTLMVGTVALFLSSYSESRASDHQVQAMRDLQSSHQASTLLAGTGSALLLAVGALAPPPFNLAIIVVGVTYGALAVAHDMAADAAGDAADDLQQARSFGVASTSGTLSGISEFSREGSIGSIILLPVGDLEGAVRVVFSDGFGEVEAAFDFVPNTGLRTMVPFLEGALPRGVEIHVIQDESVLEVVPFNVLPPTEPPDGLRPGSLFLTLARSDIRLNQGLSRMDCESVAMTEEAGFERPEVPEAIAELLETRFINSDCRRLRDASAVVLSRFQDLSEAIRELRNEARGTPAQGMVTQVLTNLDALIMTQVDEADMLDELRNELIPEFRDGNRNGIPAVFE